MEGKKTIIKITRSKSENKEIALIKLDKFNHEEGQPVLSIYDKEDGGLDAITAVGIKNGVGRDCYSIISTSGYFVVNEVFFHRLPDVAELINNGIYLSKGEGDKWCITEIDDKGIARKPNYDIPDQSIYLELSSGFRWFFKNNEPVREDDFLTPNKIQELVKDSILKTISTNISASIYEINGVKAINAKGTVISDLTFKISVTDLAGNDVTNDCFIEIYNETFNRLEEMRYISDDGEYTIYGDHDTTSTFTIKSIFKTGDNSEVSCSTSVDLIFADCTLYGAISDNETELNNGNATSQLYIGTGDLVINTDLDKQRLVVKVPAAYKKFSHIFDIHGIDYINDYAITEETTDNVTYNVYTLIDNIRITNFKQIFTHREQ